MHSAIFAHQVWHIYWGTTSKPWKPLSEAWNKNKLPLVNKITLRYN